MKMLADDIWIFDGESVPFFGLPYSTRMTVVRLSSGDLWVHRPIKLSASIMEQVDNLGGVKYLIAPNQLHHLFLPEWMSAYPNAEVHGTDGVMKKRSDLSFHAPLNNSQRYAWDSDIEHELFTGSPLMEECVFYHHHSGTLIVTDLVENFSGNEFNGCQRVVAKGAGILAPNGKTPLDWRLSFIFGKAKARKHFNKVLSWNPQVLVMAHGEIVSEETDRFLHRSFKWLL
ncbi:DUF4336 domain-containing protein [Marinomonas gallaica]|uniref:DUF4336 domain-containing protein n=1 Tax=Marinomonas gallaica TaxID=1806667 RepID=UPI00082AB4F1|nr:DUF4336 domain-containing protein [Marinomonas gallaica]